ncbi:hypothetical protein [Labilibaculum sp.]|uniref:endonuclease/exonuclease/phosphatase family protein n=1 Tax=Labilibaculum sp. TaxID=2060723 RepID=UPI0038B3CCE1
MSFYNSKNFFDTIDDLDKNDDDFLSGVTNHWAEDPYSGKFEKIAKSIAFIQTNNWLKNNAYYSGK